MRREVAIRLPPELNAPSTHVGLLSKSLYGLRDAPQIWADHIAQSLIDLGFELSPTIPGVFRHRQRKIKLACHVDDVVASGNAESLNWLTQELQRTYDLKSEILGTHYAKVGKFF